MKLLKYDIYCHIWFTACSVADGFFPYLVQMITTMRGRATTFDLDQYLQGHSHKLAVMETAKMWHIL